MIGGMVGATVWRPVRVYKQSSAPTPPMMTLSCKHPSLVHTITQAIVLTLVIQHPIMPLTPLTPSALNSNLSPSSALHSRSLLLEMADDNMTPSKPAVEKLPADEINWKSGNSSPFVTELASAEPSTNNASAQDMTTLRLDLTPSRQLKMESAPFKICEDETSIPGNIEATPLAASIKKASVVSSIQTDDIEAFDDAHTAEDDTIDDTCFSAFSEVPNMDMTRFAHMGNQSPSKHSILNQVSS